MREFNPGPHITAFYAENVKRLRVVQITPSGDVVQITGANGSGKSSVLDALYWALSGTKAIDEKPIREGSESAVVRLELGPEVIVERKWNAKGTTLTVRSADGHKFTSPQALLDELVSSLALDPEAFMRMSPKDRLDALRKIVPLEIDLDEIDAKNAADFAERTDVNRDVKALEVQRAAAGPVETLPEGRSLQELQAEVAGATKHNSAIAMERGRRMALENAAEYAREKALRLRNEAQALLTEAEEREQQADVIESELRACEPLEAEIDTEAVAAEMARANEAARARERNEARRQLDLRLAEARGRSEGLTQRMLYRTERKVNALARAVMPVEGLQFGESGVLYKGIPLEQASGAEQWRVCVAIAMAANPKLRVIRIKEGSLLDSASKQIVAEMAHEAKCQVWMECVDESGTVGVVLVDGAVAGAPTPEEVP